MKNINSLIKKKVYFFIGLLMAISITNVNAQLLQWNTFGNLGTETTEPSTFNDPNLSGVTNLTQGSITAVANGNRFGGNNWFDAGDTNPTTLAESVAGNDYIQFIVTPNVGFSFTPTSFVFTWDRSATGPSNVTLRSSVDGFTTDLGTITGIVSTAFATNTITISGLTNITTATTFRLYGYGATGTGGTGGFDIGSNVVNVQLNGTTAPTGSPLINVTPASLTGFISFPAVPSTPPQTYSVDGANLTADIILTPPVGFDIALAAGGPYIVNPATINLTPAAGTVPATTIYVQMNSGALGLNTDVITHTSTGATQKDVTLSGNVLANEPASQGVISFGTITNSTIQVNFTAGAGPSQILLVKALSSVNTDPADGVTYTPDAVFGAGTQLGTGNYTVYTGVSGGSVIVSGLIVGTQYHFALYEYDDEFIPGAENYLISPLSVGDATTTATVNTFTWIGGSSLWTTAANWTPTRTFPATNDILLFSDGTSETVTGVPNQTIGQLSITGNTNVTLQATTTGLTLTISGGAGTDIVVAAGSQLNIATANVYTLSLLTGTVAIIDGAMTFTAGAHKLIAADVNAVTFNSGAVFTAGTGFSGNAFGIANLNSIVFANGARYDYTTGSNPFGASEPNSVLTFQTGSLFRAIGTNPSPAFSGRTYADVEFAATGTATMSGGSAVTMDNLTITSGIVNIGMTGTPGHSIKGNISVASGAALNFNTAGGTLNLNGTTAQIITNNGTFTYGALQSLTINNAAGVTLNSSIILGATTTLTLTSGILRLTPSVTLITLSAGTTLAGTISNTNYVDGKVKKIGNTNFTFPVGKTAVGYVPVGISNFSGAPATDEFTAEYIRGNARLLGTVTDPNIDHVSACDYWTLDRSGSATPTDITAYWSTNNVCTGTYIDDLTKLELVHFNGTNWDNSSWGSSSIGGTSTTTAGDITWPGVTTFSPFSLGSTQAGVNPLPISINYFNGTKQNGNHLLNWKVTCNSTSYVTIEMQRSTDGRSYSSIYSIYATALRCQQPFDYTDAQPAAGVNYYRLKMTDANGKINYSSIVSLINAVKGINILNIAPNPIVNGKFNLKVSTALKAQMEIVITDMQGRLMQKQLFSLIAGFNTIPMNVTDLSAGSYQVYGITADGRSGLLRFVIQ